MNKSFRFQQQRKLANSAHLLKGKNQLMQIFSGNKESDFLSKKPKVLVKYQTIKDEQSSKESIWWSPVWSSLVLDKKAKHRRVIKQAIWLYLYFLTVANRRTGISYRKISTIAIETGFEKRSINRWLKLLRDKKYIETQSSGRALKFLVTKWKPISKKGKWKATNK